MNTVEKLKKAIILINGTLPKPKYGFEIHELEEAPISYYKRELRNLVSNIHDEWYERTNHCVSRDCSGWRTGPAPESCKSCSSYHKDTYSTPKIQEVYP